ncbi:threonine-phosphate decarboxylase [Bacillus mesophilus]|uniref:threonine-phosphate decarboxylase n=1 Tax=Bacillus mesophilus TaxID=1808955 RepID=A0A6M0Q4G6_9BACI|nr:threonine-phosphate decarboxylase [Bacillus mesophilus]NEY71287.1 threonine-phosphate decarboxylase [Bacillus mesophilus]
MFSITTFPKHGANPIYLYEKLHTPLHEEIVDFSVNVNPFEAPYDLSTIIPHFEKWLSDYPDPELTSVKNAISLYDQIDPGYLFIGNGASQCIFLLAQLFQNRTIGIVQPTFVEYKEACEIYGCTVKELKTTEKTDWQFNLEEIRDFMEGIDVLFLCNPNNPTGTVINQDRMKEVIEIGRETNTYLVIDEAFYDFSTINCSVVTEVEKQDHLIVLRSLTKMYKLAGIRIGYIVAAPSIINKVAAYSPPWSVNTLAAELAKHVLSLTNYPHDIKSRIRVERERVVNELKKLGYYVSPSSVNFYLLSDSFSEYKMKNLMKYLVANGVVPRHTYNFIGLDGKFLRLAVKDQRSNDVLLTHLKGWKQRC